MDDASLMWIKGWKAAVERLNRNKPFSRRQHDTTDRDFLFPSHGPGYDPICLAGVLTIGISMVGHIEVKGCTGHASRQSP